MRLDEVMAGERAKTKDHLESSRKNRNQNVLARSLPEKRPQHQMNHKSMIFGFSVREKTANEKIPSGAFALFKPFGVVAN